MCSGFGSLGKWKALGFGELGIDDECSNANVPWEVRRIRLPDARPQLEECPGGVISLPVDFVCKETDENDMTDVSPVRSGFS